MKISEDLGVEKSLSAKSSSSEDEDSIRIGPIKTKSLKKQTTKNNLQNKQLLTMVNYIKSMDEFNAMLETSKSKAVIIDFTATW